MLGSFEISAIASVLFTGLSELRGYTTGGIDVTCLINPNPATKSSRDQKAYQPLPLSKKKQYSKGY
jgi:hypothetical protein